MAVRTQSASGGFRAVAVVLFLALFASQAGAIALTPVLAEVARDLDVLDGDGRAAAHDRRPAAGITALGLACLAPRFGLGRQLLAGSGLLALGSLASAAAPGIALLALAQVPVGAGIAVLTTAGDARCGGVGRPSTEYGALLGADRTARGMDGRDAAARRRGRAELALRLARVPPRGGPGRRCRGRPGRSGAPPAARAAVRPGAIAAVPGLGRWLAREAFANSGPGLGTLVFAGALFVESYGASTVTTGIVLALGAGAHVAATLALRRLGDREPQRLLVPFALALAATTLLFGALRASLPASAALFAAAAFAAGGRAFLASAYGLTAPPEVRPAAMALRAASMQFGYFAGSLAAGGFAVGGYTAFGATVGMLCVGAAVCLVRRPRRSAQPEAVAVHG